MRKSTNQKSLASVNVWKLLFICSTALYIMHYLFSGNVYSQAKSKSTPAYATKNIEMSTDMLAKVTELLHSSTISASIKDEPFSSSINGRPFLIYNNTGNVHSMISNLKTFRKSPAAKLNEVIGDYGQCKAKELRFLHIPKAGKAFAVTMMHYCCEFLSDLEIDVALPANYQAWKFDPTCRKCLMQPVTVNGDYLAHFPYIKEVDDGKVITLLRDPTLRLAFQIDQMRRLRGLMTSYGVLPTDASVLSLLLSGKISEALKQIFNVDDLQGINFPSFANQFSTGFLEKVEECLPYILHRNASTAVNFDHCRFQMTALYPGLLGCQTKMLIGRNCVDTRPVTADDVELAKSRLRNKVLFVGLYEQWNQSVVLFHKLHGGKLYLDELRRPFSNPKREDLKVANSLAVGSIRDPYDEELYEFAKTMFHEIYSKNA